jgi:hypothetical protein
MPPEWREGLRLQDNVTVTPMLAKMMHSMISRINEATKNLPDLSVKSENRHVGLPSAVP